MLRGMKKPAPSLRERKKTRTRHHLIEAARRLFLKKGFEGTTVDEIAQAADVSQRTFFRYFPTKEAVVFSQHDDRIERLRTLLRRSDVPVGYAAVRQAVLEFAAWYAAGREELLDEYRIVMSSPLLVARDVELDTEYEAAIAEALGDADGAEPVTRRRARLVAGALFGTIRATLQEWFAGGCTDDLLSLGSEGLTLVDRGLAHLDEPSPRA
jgi:AcrR family transcriptional regulator